MAVEDLYQTVREVAESESPEDAQHVARWVADEYTALLKRDRDDDL